MNHEELMSRVHVQYSQSQYLIEISAALPMAKEGIRLSGFCPVKVVLASHPKEVKSNDDGACYV